MRLLLIQPYYIGRDPGRAITSEPLGLLSLATTVAREIPQVEVRILDSFFNGPSQAYQVPRGWRSGMTDLELQAYLLAFRPDVVGISMQFTFGAENTLEIARLVKSLYPNCPVIVGGAHATLAAPEIIRDHSCIDIVVRHEGEATLVDVLRVLAGADHGAPARLALMNCPGVTFRGASNSPHSTPPRPALDPNWLPIPNRALLPDYRAYLAQRFYWHTLGHPVATISSSRGCPFRCSFCSLFRMWGNQWRGRSAALVLEECLYLRDTYGVCEVAFQDDQLLGSAARMEEFCQLAIERKLGLSFIAPNGTSPCFYTPDLLRLMRRAGFYRLCFSIDVGNSETARAIHKPVRLDKIRPLVRLANRLGFWTYGTILIGFPDETPAQIQQSIRFAWSLKLDTLRFYIAQPWWGTPLFDQLAAAGRITRELLNQLPTGSVGAMLDTQHCTREELDQYRNHAEVDYLFAHLRHFVNPRYWLEFLPKLATVRRLQYFLGLVPHAAANRIQYRS